MIAFIYGGSASGKSEFAEKLVVALPCPRLYIATLRPFDDESDERIEKHRKRRAGLMMSTVECYGDVREVEVAPDTTVILECLGNLTVNALYGTGISGQLAGDYLARGLDHLCDGAANTVIVGNDVFSSGESYSDEMHDYLEVLASASRHIAARADLVVEVVCGIPLVHKGDAQMLDELLEGVCI